jgi:hypothetical protein
MSLFTLHKNFILRTTKGHSVRFEKGKPINVPGTIVAEALAIGAQPVDAADHPDNQEEVEVVPMTAVERKAKVFEAFTAMKNRSERLDFTASGVPNAKRMPALLGFEITSRERDDYWKEFHGLEMDAKAQAELNAELEAVNAAEANA